MRTHVVSPIILCRFTCTTAIAREYRSRCKSRKTPTANLQAGDATALLLVGIARQAERDFTSAIQAYRAVLDQGCESGGRDIYAHYLISQLREDNVPEAERLPALYPKELVCSSYQVRCHALLVRLWLNDDSFKTKIGEGDIRLWP